MEVWNPRNGRARRRLGLFLAMLASWPALGTRGDEPESGALPPLTRIKTDLLRPVRAEAQPADAGKPEGPLPEIEIVETEIRTAEPAVPGAKLVLEIGRGAPEGTRFRWIQTDGPPVEISDPSKGAIEITIPAGADHLGFLLVASSADAVRVARVSVPIQGEAAKNSWGSRPSGGVKADAGDDQLGLVGHRVTLNGSRSQPGEGKGSRWLQVGGGPLQEPRQQGAFFSFVPTQPGVYKFLLMVAADGEVSEPDEVSVLIGSPPTAAAPVPPTAAPSVQPPPTPAQVVATALLRLPDGVRVGSSVADVMEAVAHRASLYESYSALQSELLRRLEVVVPADPAGRTAWNEQIFSPLTMMTAQKLSAVGLDVRHREAIEQPLTTAQQHLLRDHFQELTRAFRVNSAAR